MWTQWGGRWCVSAVATGTWKTSQVPDGHAQLSHHKTKSTLISSSTQIGGLWPENCACAPYYCQLQCTGDNDGNIGILQFAPGGIHKCSHMNSKIIRKFIRIYWINMRLKVIVSCTTSLPMMKYGITTTSQSQNDSPWSADIWIRHWRNVQGAAFKGQSTLYFGIAKGWSFWTSWNPDKLSTLTTT